VHISQNLLQLAEWAKAPILAAVIFIPLERFWPWRRQRILRRGWKADLAYVSVNGLFVWLGITALLLAVTAAQRFWLPTGTATFFSKQPLWVQTVEALLPLLGASRAASEQSAVALPRHSSFDRRT
jgi:hypothetical protein